MHVLLPHPPRPPSFLHLTSKKETGQKNCELSWLFWLFIADPCLMSVNWNYCYAVSVSIVLQSSRNITSLCWAFPPNSRYGFGWLCPTSHQNNLPDCSSSPQVQANFPQGDLPIWSHFFKLHQCKTETLFQLLILVSIWFVCQTTQVFNRLKRPCSRPSMMAAKDLS